MRRESADELLVRIEQELVHMQRTLEALSAETAAVRSRWSGDAQLAFEAAMGRAEDSLHRLRWIATMATAEARTTLDSFSEFDLKRRSTWSL